MAHGFDLQTGDERWAWTCRPISAARWQSRRTLRISSHRVRCDPRRGDERIRRTLVVPDDDSRRDERSDRHRRPRPPGFAAGTGRSAGELYALDRTGGHSLAVSRAIRPSGFRAPSVTGSCTRHRGRWDLALRLHDGRQVWRGAGPRVFYPTTLVDDALYFTSESPPEIAAFRASDGSPLWALPTTTSRG